MSTTGAVREAADAGAAGRARSRRRRPRPTPASGSKRRPRRRTYTDPADAKPPPGERLVTRRPVRRRLPARRRPTATRRRNAADWVADPPFGAKSGRRVLRQANSFFHEDAIAVPAAAGASCPANGHVRGVGAARPDAPADGASRCRSPAARRCGGARSRRRDRRTAAATLGTRKGPLPAPGAVGEADARPPPTSG